MEYRPPEEVIYTCVNCEQRIPVIQFSISWCMCNSSGIDFHAKYNQNQELVFKPERFLGRIPVEMSHLENQIRTQRSNNDD